MKTDREKMAELLMEAETAAAERGFFNCFPNEKVAAFQADFLIANGVTFATDTNDGSKWIRVKDDKPKEWVSVLGHMTDAGDFPSVRECYLVDGVFFFPALKDIHPVDRWRPMPEGD